MPKRKKNDSLNTREVLLDTALTSISDGKPFNTISLREITKAAGVVPSAFYRHFKSMDELGAVLVDQTFKTLADILQALLRSEAISSTPDTEQFIKLYIENIEANVKHLRFVISEYFNGSFQLKSLVKKELQILQSGIATEIALIYPDKKLTREDLMLLAEMCVQTAIIIAKKALDHYQSNHDKISSTESAELVHNLEKQLKIILIGIHYWDNTKPAK